MNNGRNYVFGILALVVSVAAITLAYAGFTQTLTINGSATVKAVSWNVHFANVTTNVTGTASFTTAPSAPANSTTITSWVAQLASPGDTATINFTVENTGNFAAKWTGLTKGNLSCSGPTNATTVCNNLTYKLLEGSTEKTTADNTTLAALTGKKTYKLVLTFKDAANLDPSVLPQGEDVTVTIPQVTFTYTQDGNAVLNE